MLLLTLTIVSVIIVYLSGSNLLLGVNSLSDEMPSSSSTFAIIIKSSDGNYGEYSEDAFPTDMVFNDSLSHCVDADDQLVENVLSYTNGMATVTSNETVYCYLYFDYEISNLADAYNYFDDLDAIVNSGSLDNIDYLWNSTLDGDGYRYYSDIVDTLNGTSITLGVQTPSTSETYCSFQYNNVYYASGTGSCSNSTVYGCTYSNGDNILSYFYNNDYSNLIGKAYVTSSAGARYYLTSCSLLEGTEYTVTTGESFPVRYHTYSSFDPDNYVCFGTTDSSTCLNNTSKYLYRIIGIFADSDGHYHLKLIKDEALSTTYVFSSSAVGKWSSSTLYSGLNSTSTSSSYFLYKSTYISSSEWRNYIDTWSWKQMVSDYAINRVSQVTSTSTSGSGYTYTYTTGTSYTNMTAEELYDAENNTTSTVSAKVGLMYPADSFLALGEISLMSDLNLASGYINAGWLGNSSGEWIMAVDGEYTSTTYTNGTLTSTGDTTYNYSYIDSGVLYNTTYTTSGVLYNNTSTTDTYSVRPTFYLTTDVIITGGDGSSTSPYILSSN